MILRPDGKAQQSCQYFQSAGIPAVGLALLEIVPDPQALSALGHFSEQTEPSDLAIFVSTYAAQFALTDISPWPTQVQAIAVGESTAKVLRQHGLTPLLPAQPSSEGLLDLAALNSCQERRIHLFKGQGGRKLLADTLRRRGALVHEYSLYQRRRIWPPLATAKWQAEQIQCIIATSGELIEAAFAHLDSNWLKHTPWLLVSQRTADIAAKLGVEQIYLSQGASDQALAAALQDFLEQ